MRVFGFDEPIPRGVADRPGCGVACDPGRIIADGSGRRDSVLCGRLDTTGARVCVCCRMLWLSRVEPRISPSGEGLAVDGGGLA